MSDRVLRFPRRAPAPASVGLDLGKLEPPPLARARTAPPAAVAALDARADEPLTVLEGPPGSGKTALLATWINGTARPAAWLSLDPDDADPVRFAAHFAAAVQRAQPELSRDLDGLCTLPASAEIEVIWAQQLVEPLRQSGARAAVVLDDLHHVLDTPPIVAALRWLLTVMPPGLSLLASSARPVPFTTPLSGWRAAVHLEAAPPDVHLPPPLAVPERLCGDLVEALLGTEDGAAALEGWARSDGVRGDDRRGQWYRLRPDVRASLHAELDAATRADAHRIAADWFLEQGHDRAAVRHLAQAGADAERVDPARAERLLDRRAFDPLRALLRGWPPGPDRARFEAWRLLLSGAPRRALAVVRDLDPAGDPEIAALFALAELRLGRHDAARGHLVDHEPNEASPRAAAALALVAGRLRDDGDPERALQRLAEARTLAAQAPADALGFEAARFEIELLSTMGRLDEAKSKLRAASERLDDRHLRGTASEAMLACAEATLAAKSERWTDVLAAAGRGLDVLDPLPVAPERARLAEWVRAGVDALEPRFDGDHEILEALSRRGGHRGLARGLGVSVAQARLRVQAALEPLELPAWWMAWSTPTG